MERVPEDAQPSPAPPRPAPPQAPLALHASPPNAQAHDGFASAVVQMASPLPPDEPDDRLAEGPATHGAEGQGGGGGAVPAGEAGGGAEGRDGPEAQEEEEAAAAAEQEEEEEGEEDEEEDEEDEDEEGLELALAPGTATGYKGVYVFKVPGLPS